MHHFPRVAIFLAVCVSQFAYASGKDASVKEEAPGHYYLEGATEVGSELLLSKSGKFKWMLMYGNVDYSAHGMWQQKGSQVVLSTGEPEAPVFRLFTDDEWGLQKSIKPGIWGAIVGVPRVGPVADVEVRFEAKSGKVATAVSDRNGDAIVSMPSGEQWARCGLRRLGSEGEWQWLGVPAERARARVAAFAITNPQSIQSAPFKTLKLRQEERGLVVDDAAFRVRGVYVKQR